MAKKRRKVTRKKSSGSGAGWRRSPITAGVAVVIILVCLYTTFLSGPGGFGGGFRADYVCTSCREVFREPYIQGQAPFPCFECDEKSLWVAVKCMGCKQIGAELPPLTDYTCAECDHTLEAKLPGEPPHACPKCSAKALWETFFCNECEKTFSTVEYMSACPACQSGDTLPALEKIPACEHCDGPDLGMVTPYAVMKWELGKDLTPKEEKEVEAWKAKQ